MSDPKKEQSAVEVMQPMTLDSLSRAEIDMQIATAKRYPRQLSVVKANMMTFATMDQETAEACFYTLPRGGKTIQGPSIRLAEIAVSSYQNLRAGSRIIAVDSESDQPHVVIQAVCHDLEKNVAVTIEKRRRIVGKKKNEGRIDEDDINLAANAGSAIAFRDAVFKVVPLALVKPVFEAAKQVAVGSAKTLMDRRQKAFQTFDKMGVSRHRVLTMLEKRTIEDVTLEDLEVLIGLHNAIRDGQTSIDEAFPEPKPEAAPAPTPTTPAQPATQSATPAPATSATAQPEQLATENLTPQQTLQMFVIDSGYNFTQFQNWAEQSGMIDNAASLASFQDVPTKAAERCLRAKTGLLAGLQKAVQGTL
jgi:hypothetical protein